jgi:hypothetical protein
MKKLDQGIDWKNHALAMVASIVGIFIGLNLEEAQRNREQLKRLKDYQVLIDNEVNQNVSEIQTFIDKSYCYEKLAGFFSDHIDESKSMNENDGLLFLNVTKRKIDSLINHLGREHFEVRWEDDDMKEIKRTTPGIPIFIESHTDRTTKAALVFRSFDCRLQNTVWESFKNTDLVNNMKPEEIFRYSAIYNNFDLITREGEFDQPVNRIQKTVNKERDMVLDKRSDWKLADYRERFDNLSNDYARLNLFIDKKLFSIKSALNQEHQLKLRVVFEVVN